MNNLTRALAASAIVALGLGATALVLRPGGGAGGQASAGPSAATASPRPLSIGDPAAMAAGTWVTSSVFRPQVTFTLAAGWSGNMPGPFAVWLGSPQQPEKITFETIDRVVADPCHAPAGDLDPQPGPSVDALATALAGLPGIESTTPIDITIDGYRGKQLTLTTPLATTGCTLAPSGLFRIWELPRGAFKELAPGDSARVSIVDVDGVRLVISAHGDPAQSPQERAEIQGVLDSIQLAPAN